MSYYTNPGRPSALRGFGLIPPYDEISHFRAPYKNAVFGGYFGQTPECPPGQVADADRDFQCVPDPNAAPSSASKMAPWLLLGGAGLIALVLLA
jgi:hypothetical protein